VLTVVYYTELCFDAHSMILSCPMNLVAESGVLKYE